MKRQPRQCLKSEKGCFGKEEEPHSSLLCLFVLLLVVHGLVFPIPLLSVGGASLKIGNNMVFMHHSTIVCVFCVLRDKRVDTTVKTNSKEGSQPLLWFFFNLSFPFDTFIKCLYRNG